MADWAMWITRSVGLDTDVLDVCVEGPVNSFAAGWPQFVQHELHPKVLVGDLERGATAPECIYQVYLFGLCHALRWKGWETTIEPRGGTCGYIDICLVSKTLRSAVLIVLKSSKQKRDIKKDAVAALDQIGGNTDYRNSVGLANVQTSRIWYS